MNAIRRSAAWIKDAPLGMEYCDLTIEGSGPTATAVAIGSQPLPYRLDYELETHDNWVTARLVARTRGEGWAMSLSLERSSDGVWTWSRDGQGELPGAEDGQRYIIVKRARNQNLVRYESVDGEFVAMLTCDDDALAIDYPAIARRLARPGRS